MNINWSFPKLSLIVKRLINIFRAHIFLLHIFVNLKLIKIVSLILLLLFLILINLVQTILLFNVLLLKELKEIKISIRFRISFKSHHNDLLLCPLCRLTILLNFFMILFSRYFCTLNLFFPNPLYPLQSLYILLILLFGSENQKWESNYFLVINNLCSFVPFHRVPKNFKFLSQLPLGSAFCLYIKKTFLIFNNHLIVFLNVWGLS